MEEDEGGREEQEQGKEPWQERNHYLQVSIFRWLAKVWRKESFPRWVAKSLTSFRCSSRIPRIYFFLKSSCFLKLSFTELQSTLDLSRALRNFHTCSDLEELPMIPILEEARVDSADFSTSARRRPPNLSQNQNHQRRTSGLFKLHNFQAHFSMPGRRSATMMCDSQSPLLWFEVVSQYITVDEFLEQNANIWNELLQRNYTPNRSPAVNTLWSNMMKKHDSVWFFRSLLLVHFLNPFVAFIVLPWPKDKERHFGFGV